jgi:hypothetical protein
MQHDNPNIGRAIIAITPTVFVDKNTPFPPVKYYWQDNGCEAVWDDKKGWIEKR